MSAHSPALSTISFTMRASSTCSNTSSTRTASSGSSIRTLVDSSGEDVFLLRLDKFLPLVQLLSPHAHHTDTDHKLDYMFRILDVHNKGVLSAQEIHLALESAVAVNNMYLSEADRGVLVDELMHSMQANSLGLVNRQRFRGAARQWDLTKVGLPLSAPDQGPNRDIDISAADYIGASAAEKAPASRLTRIGRRLSRAVRGDRSSSLPGDTAAPQLTAVEALRRRVSAYLALEGRKLFWVLFFAATCLAVFLHKFLTLYAMEPVTRLFGVSVAVAKGSAAVMNFTMMLQLLLVSRTLLTRLRSIASVERWVPIDKNIVWHRYVGAVFIAAAGVHTIVHLTRTFPIVAHTRLSRLKQVINLPAGTKSTPSMSYLYTQSLPGVTGWLLVVIVVLLACTSLARVRRSRFEVFWYTHHLSLFMIPLVMLHSSQSWIMQSTTWRFVLVPCLVYGAERLQRWYRSFEAIDVVDVVVQQDTIELILDRPSFMKHYLAGQYIFLNVPHLSSAQWHPFTLTSSPMDAHLTVRIKKAGDWTGELHKSIKDIMETRRQRVLSEGVVGRVLPSPASESPPDHLPLRPPPASAGNGSSVLARSQLTPVPDEEQCAQDSQDGLQHLFTVRVDGAFGAPSQTFFQYDHVVLVAAGVGITPFISILNAIEHFVKSSHRGSIFKKTHVREVAHMKSVDLFWLNRDPKAYQWFSETLKGLYQDRAVQQWLRVHTFVTSAKGREDIRSFLLWWGLQLVSKRYNRCLLTGTEHCVSWGRPHWGTVFEQVARKYPGKKVGVFFCGPKALGKELYDLCRLMNSRGGSSATWFEFAKENF
ncbi:hypothetical protein RI367_001301 [Sorochytrium milnesiophthora]